MKCKCAFFVPMILIVAAILVFMASQPRFGYIDESLARFIGVALILLSGLAWVAMSLRSKSAKYCCKREEPEA